MIARVYESIEKTTLQKTKKSIIKEKKVKKKIETWEEKLVEPEPQEGYCGRCNHAYHYGDNSRNPEKCSRCVCIDCGTSIMERKRLSTYGGIINRCYACWYKYHYGKKYYGNIKGWEIDYSHSIPKKLPPIKKKVVVEKDIEVIESYTEDIEVEEPVTMIENRLVEVENIDYNLDNKVIKNEFDSYQKFINNYLGLNKYLKDSYLSKHDKWHGSISHNQVLELLSLANKKEKVEIDSLAAIEYNQLIVGEKQTVEEFPSVVGFYPNVPAYIQGHPLNMYNNKRVNRVDIERSIHIYFNATMDSENFESQYKNRGIICYSLMDYLINEENVKVILTLIDASFIEGETLIQTINFNSETIKNNMMTIYNFLTTSAVLRVMMLEYKAAMVNEAKINKVWLDGFGFYLKGNYIRELLNLNENDILFSTPDELKISGIDLEDDFINCMESLGLNNSFFSEKYMNISIDKSITKPNDTKEIIKKRGITKLIHFTSEENIESIKKMGLISRLKLSSRLIDFDFNDSQRLENELDAICLSVQIPNKHLLDEFFKRYPEKKYKIIEINPAILYDLQENNLPVKKIFCDYNAASRYAQKSTSDIDIMFKDEIRKRQIIHNRIGKNENEPTCDQAEILFFGDIPFKYIIGLDDCDNLNTETKKKKNVKNIANEKETYKSKDISKEVGNISYKNVKIGGVNNVERIVKTYKKTDLEHYDLPTHEIIKSINNGENIFFEIGSEYFHKNLVGKVVLLSRIGKAKNGDLRYYFNKEDEVAISEQNIKKIYKAK